MLFDRPVKHNDEYKDSADDKNKKWIGQRGFRFASTSQDRLDEAAYKNQYLDTQPTALCFGTTPEKLMNLRQREASKELAGEWRHKPKNAVERVYDTLS